MSLQRTCLGCLAALAVTSIVAACAGAAPATPPSSAPPIVAQSAASAASPSPAAATQPVIMRVATVEADGTPEGRAILAFAEELGRRTHGSVSVLPIFETGETDLGNIQGVQSGLIDMAIVQARAWDELGVTTMQALQTPFLLSSEDAAVAATSGELATRLEAGLEPQGVIGLMLWPIDLRHFVSFSEPILDPKDVAGRKVRIVGSTINQEVVTSLGGTPVSQYETGVDAGESAFDRAYSLPTPGTFTGNVTLYPRIDLLFMGRKSFERLSTDQQTLLREATEATRAVLVGKIVPDPVQAKGYCKDKGGSVALASAAQVKAFETALAPVEATISANATSKALINDLRTMVNALPAPATSVEACRPD